MSVKKDVRLVWDSCKVTSVLNKPDRPAFASGGFAGEKIAIWCLHSNLFACTSMILAQRSTRHRALPSASGLRADRQFFVQIFCKEILVCKHPDIGRGAKIVPVLYRVPVDGEWKHGGICSEVPRSQSLGIGRPPTAAVASRRHITPVVMILMLSYSK